MRERQTRENDRALERMIPVILAILILAFSAVNGALILYWQLKVPYRVEADCRFQTMQMEEILRIQKQNAEDGTGLIDVAAWRFGDAGKVTELLLGKSTEAATVYVCGTMSVAFPARVMSGSFGQVMEQGTCVISKELSHTLFGSVDTAGCQLQFGGKSYQIAAVIDIKERIILFPAKTGWVETAAFLFQNRKWTKETMSALGFEH